MTRLASFPHCPLSLGLFIAVTCLTIGCNRTPKPADEKIPPAPAKWEGPRQMFLEEWTELVGTTQPLPDHAARVTAPVGGVVVSVLPARVTAIGITSAVAGVGGSAISLPSTEANKAIVEGQMVQEGDILAQLDASAIQASLAKAQAAKKVLQAEQEVAAFAVKQASVEVKRLDDLKKQQGGTLDQSRLVSPVLIEKAGLALESAQASVRADDRKLEAADKEEAALEQQIRLYTLTAPRKGRLGRLQVVIGQTLSLGATVAEVVDIEDEIDVLCFVSPSEARKLQIGQLARIGGFAKPVPGESAPDPEGKVVYIADQAEAETGSFAVKVRFPNVDLKLRASSVARIRILTKPGRACWAVPEAALMEDQDPPTVIVVEDVEIKKNAEGKDEQIGKARRLQADIGVRDRVLHQVEILTLKDPDKKWKGNREEALVIVEKGQSLQTGDAVKLDEEEDDEAPKPDEKP